MAYPGFEGGGCWSRRARKMLASSPGLRGGGERRPGKGGGTSFKMVGIIIVAEDIVHV